MKRVLLITVVCCLLLQTAVMAAEVKINGTVLDTTGYEAIFNVGDYALVPLRPIVTALGGTIDWNAEDMSMVVTLNDQSLSFAIGTDSYVGDAGAVAFGCPPLLYQDSTYVPIQVFSLYGLTTSAAGDAAELRTVPPINHGGVNLPNPMKPYDTVEAALTALGFTVKTPVLPYGYVQESVYAIQDEVLDVRYQSGEKSVTFRAARGSASISGVYETYAWTEEVNGILMQGSGDMVNLATWEKDGFSYAIYAKDGLSRAEMSQMAESI